MWKKRIVLWCGEIEIGIISVGFEEEEEIEKEWLK